MSIERDVERSDDLPLSELQSAIEQGILRLGGRVKYTGRSAFHHLRQAWKLHYVDNEMALFRAITAEEEAATALMLALKQQRYPGAQKLNPWKHDQKSAFTPFLAAVSTVLANSHLPPPSIVMNKTGKPRIRIRLDITAWLGGDEPRFAEPDQPLNFVMRSGEGDDADVHMFEEELQEIAEGQGAADILAHVAAEANLRNRLLYADDKGIPSAKFSDAALIARLQRVTILLGLTIAILQTRDHQLFAIQCLEAFLRALGKLTGEGHDFGLIMDEARPLLTVRKVGDDPMTVSIT